MSDDRTLVMSNMRSSSPSFVTFDDGALTELEAGARLLGASGAGTTASRLPRSLDHTGDEPLTSAGPCGVGEVPRKTEPEVVALVAGGVVALATAATLVFHFLVS